MIIPSVSIKGGHWEGKRSIIEIFIDLTYNLEKVVERTSVK